MTRSKPRAETLWMWWCGDGKYFLPWIWGAGPRTCREKNTGYNGRPVRVRITPIRAKSAKGVKRG